MQSILVQYLAHVCEAPCWHSLQYDDIALIVLCYQTTDSKKRHQKQVWPLFVKLVQIRQVFFDWCLIPFLPLSHFLSFTSPFLTETLAHSISFNSNATAKTCGDSPLPCAPLHHHGLQHLNSPACPRRRPTSHCIYCRSFWPELWRQAFLSLVRLCLVVMFVQALCPEVFLQKQLGNVP